MRSILGEMDLQIDAASQEVLTLSFYKILTLFLMKILATLLDGKRMLTATIKSITQQLVLRE
jgi:hypothetical protein